MRDIGNASNGQPSISNNLLGSTLASSGIDIIDDDLRALARLVSKRLPELVPELVIERLRAKLKVG